jgi:alkylhydroperoxidase family enzyme
VLRAEAQPRKRAAQNQPVNHVADQAAHGDRRLEALRSFTTAAVNKRGWIKDADLKAFLQAGYTREQVLEVLVGVAMKTLSNYVNHIAATLLDKQLEPFAWEPSHV